MRIVLHGHTACEFSTETDVRRSLESMGHEVTPMRECMVTMDDIETQCFGADLFLWLHGHGSQTTGMTAERLRALPCPTVGFTLDLFRGLKSRPGGSAEAYIRDNPWFRCQWFFSADGGAPAGWWEGQGVNHRYSPPGVLESSCYLAEPVSGMAHDIVFVGARGYHPEHPRAELVAWLERTYGERFAFYEHGGHRTIAGRREALGTDTRMHRLNQLYASARVVVGDSCFAGSVERYTSDRYPESLGRGARLVYPRIPGVTDDAPCRLYEPGNFSDLAAKIEEAMSAAPEQAIAERHRAIAYVKDGWTYRHRMEAMLGTLTDEGAFTS